MRFIYLRPKGSPDSGTEWADPHWRLVLVVDETETSWHGYPVDNPGPVLEWPKFAWEKMDEACPTEAV